MTEISTVTYNATSTATSAATSSVFDTVCQAQLLVMKYQQAGGHRFDNHRPSAKEATLKAELKRLLPILARAVAEETVRNYIDAHAIWAIVSMDIMGMYPTFETRYAHFTRAFNRWLKGDKSATQEELAEIFIPLMNENYPEVDARHLRWINGLIRTWTKDFQLPFHPNVPDKATLYRRLSILIDADMEMPVSAPEKTKERLAKEYTAIDLDDIDPDALDLAALLAYQTFFRKAMPYLPTTTSQKISAKVQAALISHPNLPPALQEAVRLSMSYV